VDVPPDFETRVLGDPGRVRQILVNLIGNAVKYTENGFIIVGLREAQFEDGSPALSLFVRDTGCGISHSEQVRIFERFTQVDSHLTRRHSGAGLGLAICKRLVELMGGQISVESAPGQGASFKVLLPLEKQSITEPALSVPEWLGGRRILVADAGADQARILAAWLRHWNCQVEIALTAQDALDQLAMAAKAGQPFELVLACHCLKDLSCDQLAAEIWEQRPAKPIFLPILRPTLEKDPQFYLKLGIETWLSQPVRVDRLLSAVVRLLGKKETGLASQAPENAQGLREGLSILVVEDNPVNRKVVEKVLLKMGISTVHKAENGMEALDLLGASPVDLVLMDCQMPVLDGLEATRILRERETGGGRVPVVALTAQAMAGDREACLSAGMDDYLIKPVTHAALLEMLLRYLK